MTTFIRCARPRDLALVSSILAEAAAWLAARDQALWQLAELAPETIAPDVHAGFYYLAFEHAEAMSDDEASGRRDEPAGVMRLTLDDPQFWPEARAGDAVYVHRLAVRRAFAGATVSHALLRFAADEAKRRGCAAVRLDCIAARPKLRAIYEHFGFRYHSDRHVGPYHVARYELPL